MLKGNASPVRALLYRWFVPVGKRTMALDGLRYMDDRFDGRLSLDQVLIRRYEIGKEKNPHISHVDRVILKDGPRVFRVACHLRIVNAKTGELHHHELKIEQCKKRKGYWTFEEVHSVTLEDEQEVAALLAFMKKYPDLPQEAGQYSVVRTVNSQSSVRDLLQLLSTGNNAGVAEVLAELIRRTHGDRQTLRALTEHASRDPEASRQAVAALNLARFQRAVEQLEALIAADAPEESFQKLLQHNPWMFGSEYAELLSTRRLTRDEIQDFILRRTADGYLEIIEIKTPLQSAPLFVIDRSHNSLYPGQALARTLGQVVKYLAKVDASESLITSQDGERVTKICARIIIGRDGDDQQRAALRLWNGHLHRIEVLTFDQLLRLARQTLKHTERIMEAGSEHSLSLTSDTLVTAFSAAEATSPVSIRVAQRDKSTS